MKPRKLAPLEGETITAREDPASFSTVGLLVNIWSMLLMDALLDTSGIQGGVISSFSNLSKSIDWKNSCSETS